MPQIILLSGPLAVGKTAVAHELSRSFGYKKISSSTYLRALAEELGIPESREALQNIGDQLDEQSNFSWLAMEVAAKQLADDPTQMRWFVDAVRKPQQIEHFRNMFPCISHFHVTASEDILRGRFFQRSRESDDVNSVGSYEKSISHPNEFSSRALEAIADAVIDLGALDPLNAAIQISYHIEGAA